MRRRARWQWVAIVGGLVLIGSATGFEVDAVLWEHHSEAVGHALVKRLRAAQARNEKAPRASTAKSASKAQTCLAASVSGGDGTPVGLIVAPSIGLVAPVLQGSSNAVLSVAVGHDPHSVWPGKPGNAVLLAHDVSYFVHIDELHVGQLVTYETACTKTVFEVAGHHVIAEGSPVYNTAGATMTFVTCWPTDALWFTPDRYLVSLVAVSHASLATSSAQRAHVALRSDAGSSLPKVPAPAALVAEGLTLATNSIPMGTMTVTGSPSATWPQSPGPLDLQDQALQSYIGATKALQAGKTSWWADLAPGLAPPPELGAGSSISYASALDVAVAAVGTRPTGATLSSSVDVTGGREPGAYDLRVVLSVEHGELLITSWTMAPAGG